MAKRYVSTTERQNRTGKQREKIESTDKGQDFEISRKILVLPITQTDNLNDRRDDSSNISPE